MNYCAKSFLAESFISQKETGHPLRKYFLQLNILFLYLLVQLQFVFVRVFVEIVNLQGISNSYSIAFF